MALHYFDDMIVKSVMCIEKEWELKEDVPFWGTYHAPRWILYFERRIARRDGYYISRDVSHAAMVTIIEGRVMRRDRCMDRYVPHGSRTERQRVCITRLDMHHYTWHCIPLHLHMLIISELGILFCWSCEWLSVELVIDEYWACWWGYKIC